MPDQSDQSTDHHAAAALLGMTLDGGWHVRDLLDLSDDEEQEGAFSAAYRVEHDDGRVGFCKALDYAAAFDADDPADSLQRLTSTFLYQRELHARCEVKKMSRVVRILDAGKIQVPGYSISTVQYLIFELADLGDIRRLFDREPPTLAGRLRALHHVCTGVVQLHMIGVAHQNVKLANVLAFPSDESLPSFSHAAGPGLAKLAGLGCACDMSGLAPTTDEAIPGDTAYSPPELLYGQVSFEFATRRFACDAYLMGSLVYQVLTGVTFTAALGRYLETDQHWSRWNGTYEQALPYVIDAYGQALGDLRGGLDTELPTSIYGSMAERLTAVVAQLCHPDPARRGHPTRRNATDQYDLARYRTALDRLARDAVVGAAKARDDDS